VDLATARGVHVRPDRLPWSGDLRRVRTGDELQAFTVKTFELAKSGLSERFDDAFRRLFSSSVQQYRLRYISK
jgi:hypothetical protein